MADLVGERGVEGGILTAFPDPVRSCKPPSRVVGLRLGILEMVSLRFLVGLCDLMITSSLESGFTDIDFGRVCPGRSGPGPMLDEFSFFSIRTGEPSRAGVGIDEECFGNVGVVFEGVRGESPIWRCS